MLIQPGLKNDYKAALKRGASLIKQKIREEHEAGAMVALCASLCGLIIAVAALVQTLTK